MTLTTPLVGMHYHPPAKQVLAILPVGHRLALQAEPDNPYDVDAVEVLIDLSFLAEASSEVRQVLEESLAGTGFEMEELVGTMKLGHVGASGRGPCLKLGLPGTLELHEFAREYDGLESLSVELGFTPSGAPTLQISQGVAR